MDIEKICRRYGIRNYTINEDGSIDVNGNVNFYSRELWELPLNFNIVDGNFTCAINHLTTLKGSPKKVTGYFNCNNNENLGSLEHAPVEIGTGFGAAHCGLTSLEHFPQSVGDKIILYNNSIESYLEYFLQIYDICKKRKFNDSLLTVFLLFKKFYEHFFLLFKKFYKHFFIRPRILL